jgi:hypothetical protein
MRAPEKGGTAGKVLFRNPFAAQQNLLCAQEIVYRQEIKIFVGRRGGCKHMFNLFIGEIDEISITPNVQRVLPLFRIIAASPFPAKNRGVRILKL